MNAEAAKVAQEEYCVENEVPMFAPYSGICHRCCENIYLNHKRNDGSESAGYTPKESRRTHITSCPHCNASFLE